MKRNFSLLLLALVVVCNASFAQILGSPDVIRMTQAKNRFSEGDVNGALAVYLQLYTAHGANPLLNVRMAECYLVLKQGKDALAYVDKARELDANVDKELEYHAAEAYRLLGKQEEALARLEVYRKQDKLKTEDLLKTDALATKCKTTLELMAKPVNVRIASASDNINTADHHEYHPSITADGKIMVFTSRRSTDEKAEKDPYDEDYFEKVLITYWSDSLNGWAPAEPIPGGINTKGRHDASLSISPDGKQVFLYRNEIGAGDIFVSKTRMSKDATDAIENESASVSRLVSLNKWSSPLSLGKPVNSSYWESCGAISADGKTLYFVSERPKGQGSGDIWMAKRVSTTEWGTPVNLLGINTVEDEKSVFIHPDGKTLFFSSQGHRNMGGYDIFRSVLGADGTWSEPENVGYPINTPGDEFDFVSTTDGKTAYYCTSSEGSKKFDIMKLDLGKYDVLGGNLAAEKSGLCIVRGTILNPSGMAVSTKVVCKDANGASIVAETESDEDGNFFLTVPGNKDYELIVVASSYKEYRHVVKVNLNADGSTATTNHSISLEAK